MDSAGSSGNRFINVTFWIVVAGVIIIGMSLTGQWDDGSGALGIISFLVLVYVIFTACKASFAQARIDEAGIRHAHALISQCGSTVSMIDQALREPDFERAHRLLDHLYARVGLFVTQYDLYMKPGAPDVVWDMENSIVDARFLPSKVHRQCIAMLRKRLDELRANVRDVNDPTLGALRNRK